MPAPPWGFFPPPVPRSSWCPPRRVREREAGPSRGRTRDAGPATPELRSARALALVGSDGGDEREILRSDLRWIEFADVRGHAREELRHGHWRLLALLRRDPTDRVTPRHDDLTQVRAFHPVLLQRLHVRRDTIVDVEYPDSPLLALAQRRR